MCMVVEERLSSVQLSNLKLHYRRRYGITLEQWYSVCVLYGNVCLKCYSPGGWKIIGDGLWKSTLSPDHVVPVKQGGESGYENIQPLCDKCNKGKGGHAAYDYRPDCGDRIKRTSSLLGSLTPPSKQMTLF